MSIKSVDMQVLIQKTSDVARIQQIQNQGNNFRQQEISSNILQDTNQNTQTVKKPPAGEGKLVHEKQEHEKNSSQDERKRGNKAKKSNSEEEKQLDPNRGGKLDILA